MGGLTATPLLGGGCAATSLSLFMNNNSVPTPEKLSTCFLKIFL